MTNDWNDYELPKPSLMDVDYCTATTESDGEEFIPNSLRLLLEQMKNEKQLKKRILHESNDYISGQ